METNYEYSKHKELIILLSKNFEGMTMCDVEEILFCLNLYIKKKFILNQVSKPQ